MRQHLLLMCGLASRQQQQLTTLRSSVSRVATNYTGTFLWRINDFQSKMAEAKLKEGFELVSAPFYTSQYGYKLQVIDRIIIIIAPLATAQLASVRRGPLNKQTNEQWLMISNCFLL